MIKDNYKRNIIKGMVVAGSCVELFILLMFFLNNSILESGNH